MQKIQADIPIPARVIKKGRVSAFPFTELKRGESVFVPREAAPPNRVVASVRYHNLRFKPGVWTYRREELGVRVWRTL